MKKPLGILAFFDIYKRGLTKKEILKYSTNNKFNLNDFTQEGDFYFWNKAYLNEALKMRKHSEKLIKKAQKWGRFLRYLPGVKGVAICNTASFYTAEKGSDIDLFIISKEDRIWTCRVFVTIFLHILGLRRYGDKIENRFCLSFFVDQKNLDISKISIKDDVFLAFWIASLIPLFGEVFDDFFSINQKFLDQFEIKPVCKDIYKKPSFNLDFLCFDFLERILKKIFLPRTSKKAQSLKSQKGTIIKTGILKFHDNDMREHFKKEFLLRIKSYKSSS